MEELLKYLESLKAGSIPDTSEVESLLAVCWDKFDDSRVGGMTGDKFDGRMENVQWEPPVLSFDIERHGRIVGGGSTRADIHRWKLDVIKRTASFEQARYRQVRPNAKRLDVNPIAEEIFGHNFA